MSNVYQDLISGNANLLNYWKLDDSGTNTALDSKGSQNGTYNGTPSFNQSNLGQSGIPAGGTSVQWLGTGTASSYATTSAFTITATFSLEGWIYLPSDPGVAQNFLNFHTAGNFGLSLYLSSARVPNFQVIDTPGANPNIAANGAISLNTWHHIVGKCLLGTSIHMYVDGVLQSASASVLTPVIASSAKSFWFASDASGLIGKIDEVAIYNTDLADSVVLLHYNTGITAPLGNQGAAILPAM